MFSLHHPEVIDLTSLLFMCNFSDPEPRVALISILSKIFDILEKLPSEQSTPKEKIVNYAFIGKAIANSFNPEAECDICIEKFRQVCNR